VNYSVHWTVVPRFPATRIGAVDVSDNALHARLLRHGHLAILLYAVTREAADGAMAEPRLTS
jgi:hypothetical protein